MSIELIAVLRNETKLFREAYDRLKSVLPTDGKLTSGLAVGGICVNLLKIAQ